MSVDKKAPEPALAGRFDRLVAMMAPQAIRDEGQYDATLQMIGRLTRPKRLTPGQSLYLETLVQLVQAYESEHSPMDDMALSGVDALRHLLDENDLNASDLGRLLGVHASMGSKILNGTRSLTVEHFRTLAARFGVRPELFVA